MVSAQPRMLCLLSGDIRNKYTDTRLLEVDSVLGNARSCHQIDSLFPVIIVYICLLTISHALILWSVVLYEQTTPPRYAGMVIVHPRTLHLLSGDIRNKWNRNSAFPACNWYMIVGILPENAIKLSRSFPITAVHISVAELYSVCWHGDCSFIFLLSGDTSKQKKLGILPWWLCNWYVCSYNFYTTWIVALIIIVQWMTFVTKVVSICYCRITDERRKVVILQIPVSLAREVIGTRTKTHRSSRIPYQG